MIISFFGVVKDELLLYGICEAVDGEKDPHCLMVVFHVIQALVQLFPYPSGPLANFSGELFETLSSYFPIHFTHVSKLLPSLNVTFFLENNFLVKKKKFSSRNFPDIKRVIIFALFICLLFTPICNKNRSCLKLFAFVPWLAFGSYDKRSTSHMLSFHSFCFTYVFSYNSTCEMFSFLI